MSILGQADCTASTNNLVVTLSAATTCNIALCNRTNAPIVVSLAIVPTGTVSPAAKHWIEYNHSLDGYQILERFGIPLGNGDQVFVAPGASGISCSVWGLK